MEEFGYALLITVIAVFFVILLLRLANWISNRPLRSTDKKTARSESAEAARLASVCAKIKALFKKKLPTPLPVAVFFVALLLVVFGVARNKYSRSEFEDAQAVSYDSGYETGYSEGKTAGYESGQEVGSSEGYAEGYEVGCSDGYEAGYSDGYEKGISEATTTSGYNSDESYSDTVYITDTGTKYHRSGCSYLTSSKHAISKAEAQAQGYTPCSRCNP